MQVPSAALKRWRAVGSLAVSVLVFVAIGAIVDERAATVLNDSVCGRWNVYTEIPGPDTICKVRR